MARFDKVTEGLNISDDVDYQEDSVNKKKQLRNTRLQTYLTDSELTLVGETMYIMEKPAERIRNLLLADAEKRLKGLTKKV